MSPAALMALSLLASVTPAVLGLADSFAIIGNTGASGQQIFLGAPTKVYIVDKTENNPAMVGGHPAWATEYDLETNTYRSLDIRTNSFCAGGNLLGNGSWLNVGGNGEVTTGGVASYLEGIPNGGGPYQSYSGSRAVRVITPCSDNSCNWTEDVNGMPINRWYPTLETIEDGSVIIIGGELYGGFVNSVIEMQNVPSFEFWPTRGAPINSTFLAQTQPANLYPLTWLLPNGLIFMQANWQTTLMNYTTSGETRLPNITRAQRTYPATGAIAMLPLTVENQFKPTLLFCGGMDPVRDDWNTTLWNIADTDTSDSCVSIKPMDASPTWVDDDDLDQNRGMGNFIILPDQRLFLSNGVAKGSAGYGFNIPWALNQSFGQDPVLTPAYYNGSAPAGSRFNTSLPASTVGRLYHSSSTLLPDGSIFIAGSNPNADVITNANNATYLYKTEYRAEIFYPSYFDAHRPAPIGLPTSVTYGGTPFNLTLTADSLNGTNLNNVKVALIRTGFSTHGMNMGQRYVQLVNTFTGNSDGTATLHVSQLPPNAALLVPGPALLFVVVNGIPSIGEYVMVGNGIVGKQPLKTASVLATSSGNFNGSSSSSPASGSSSSSGSGSGSGSSASNPKAGGAIASVGMSVMGLAVAVGAGLGLLAVI